MRLSPPSAGIAICSSWAERMPPVKSKGSTWPAASQISRRIQDETYIIGRLITNFPQAVQQDKSNGTAISRSGQRSENALVRELNKLGNQLTSTVPVRVSARN